ncbi:PREDICTED: uncharacterized protein LOC18612118 [Theobroma cacao]|uniref:Uncharacterized protein LOC18612118 n=1 Tax=Theobroma cacao TaxID=3641 RepID=A0AB32VPL5_THECC|nr:PREDICTED: uncharacterized protein LOC18612118 [Theobroma cacao]
MEQPQQEYELGSESKAGSNDMRQEIWEDLIINLLGLKSEYNHLLPTEDENTGDLLTMQDETISPRVNHTPSMEDSFHSNPIASPPPPTQHIVLTVVNDQGTPNKTINGCFTRAASKWGFVITNLVLETLTAACDQLSSPRQPHYALIGLLTSLSALLICIGELIYKSRKEIVSWTRPGRFCYTFPHKAIFSNFAETFGFICAVFQCIFSTVEYNYFKQHENNPIKLNIFPVVFAACLACSITCRKQDIETNHTD